MSHTSLEKNHITLTNNRLIVSDDQNIYARLGYGAAISLIINFSIWTYVSGVMHSRLIAPRPPMTFRRIIINPQDKIKPLPKPLTPKKVQIVKKTMIPTSKTIPVHTKPILQPILPEHNNIVLAKPTADTSLTAHPGGNAPVGMPITHQEIGTGNQDAPAAPPPPPTSPTPAPIVTPPPPTIVKPIEPSGPTTDAISENQVYPDIPDDLKSSDYKSYVRVKVDITADGSSSVSLLTSSGNLDVDQLALDALKRWKWKPALQDGHPVESTQRFRFNFEVQ